MESSNRASSFGNSAYANGNVSSPSPFLSDSSSSYPHSLPIASKGKLKMDEGVSHHQCCLSESILMDLEEPFWLEDLLSEPVTAVHKGHRRSASDTFAYLGAVAEELNVNVGPNVKGSTRFSSDTSLITSGEMIHKASDEPTSERASISSGKHKNEECTSQNTERSPEKTNSQQPKPYMSKGEAKRAKQQSAHRSRIRKLQHISELERTVQALQVEESVVSAELGFIDKQNLILSMENRALMHRLDSLSQEFVIKHMEQEMLERELGRLQTLCQLQWHHHHQSRPPPHHHHHHHSNHRRSRSRDLLEAQFANLSLSSNEVASSRTGPFTRSVWIQ
ncbi:hypothetical protein DM860_016010 [Cuscuta australis]|uniref:BZIP domain-containing protein n=1 Tax=Cuscuta australis TaxID=267555 RepID=A0A328DLJ1_9ASTE|nr:hypothetical protein DM860_016010 [Cuscuta australis]